MYPIKNESLRIKNSVVSLIPPSDDNISALIVVTHGGMKIEISGKQPHNGSLVVRRGDQIKLENIFEILKTKMIHDSRYCDCWISITYFKGE